MEKRDGYRKYLILMAAHNGLLKIILMRHENTENRR